MSFHDILSLAACRIEKQWSTYYMKSRKIVLSVSFLFLLLIFCFMFSGCMRILGETVQPLDDDDVPGLYHPTKRTWRIIEYAAHGRYNVFAAGTFYTE
ncbi:MAG: hypothetical protein PHI35_07455, partial [Victivallaceae bacterium]|nr:hypothetical protein [Victivallaceae bacterium]